MLLIRPQTEITIRQTAVPVYFRSTQLLPFAFARQRSSSKSLLYITFRHKRSFK